ncbi:unnamed protein product [Strongylus vulgaris]|uniref:Uncharacterized protein n=1 Tax=Strongylus vulgaris TaxID=40348 RepID=A0A3P7IS98_STRVU|nr:unnamed protein product [Strongylus vulgaris]
MSNHEPALSTTATPGHSQRVFTVASSLSFSSDPEPIVFATYSPDLLFLRYPSGHSALIDSATTAGLLGTEPGTSAANANSVMADDQFRLRVDTGCTADSKDSGIDVHSRLRNIPKRLHRRKLLKTVMEDADEAKWDIDTILWAVVFALTVWFFRLPTSIWFSKKVDW